jgi:hypothetical protein
MKSSRYDLAVAYRIYPKVSKIPAVFPDDKLQLARFCVNSFRASLGDLRVKLFVLLDNCPAEYDTIFTDCFDRADVEFIRLNGVGNQATFSRQIDILLRQEDAEVVYFAEDDYFYLPGQFARMLEFLKQNPDADFLSAYDHPDYYQLLLHQCPHEIRDSQAGHWRTAATTCLTFLTTKKTLAATRKIFETYGAMNWDASIWMSLTKQSLFYPYRTWSWFRERAAKPMMWNMVTSAWSFGWRQIFFGRRRKLWVPVPGIATHMEKDFLSPGVDWNAAFAEGVGKIRGKT